VFEWRLCPTRVAAERHHPPKCSQLGALRPEIRKLQGTTISTRRCDEEVHKLVASANHAWSKYSLPSVAE
jgi:hypothetical protein